VDYGDDYQSSLYHLALFYLNASQRGSYPGRFINGLWGWNRDVQPWNFYFHWNQQQLYWSACAAGHPELCRSYVELRLRGLGHARRDAEEIFRVPGGAMVSDVTDKEGHNSLAELKNHTPVAQVALDLYRYYQYTGDVGFLRAEAFGYMVAAARFLRSRFSKGPDGVCHSGPATGYEGWIKLTDTISEISCLEALLKAVFEAAEVLRADLPEREDYLKVLGNLAPYPRTDVSAFTGDDGTLQAGYFPGSPVLSTQMLAAGRDADTGEIALSMLPVDGDSATPPVHTVDRVHALVRGEAPGDEAWYGTRTNAGIFPWVELCPIFPAGTIGLSSRGTELYETAVNTARIMAPDGMGWSVLPIALARLGLADETEAVLATFPERWQWFPNGFGHYGSGESMCPECELRFLRREVLDADATDQRFPFEQWPFRHMGLEPLGVFSAAVNESLLQSHEGTIHVFPARKGDAAFTLYAIGGTKVSSELREGTPCFIALENTGGRARVANPWETATVCTCHGDPLRTTDARVIELDFSEAESYVLLPGDADWSSLACVPEHPRPNEAPRLSRNGIAMLGLPRMF